MPVPKYQNRLYYDQNGGGVLMRAQQAANRLLYAGQQAGAFAPSASAPVVGIGGQIPGAAGQVFDNGHVLELSQKTANQVAGVRPRTSLRAAAQMGLSPLSAREYLSHVARQQQSQGLPILLHELAHTQQRLVHNPRSQVSPGSLASTSPAMPRQAAIEGGASAFEHLLGQLLVNRAGFVTNLHDSPDAGTTYGDWRQSVLRALGVGFVTHGQFG